MCGLIDLKKAYLKESYPLPKIMKLVDTMAEHAMLSFMHTYGYHQIPLYQEDQEKTTSITNRGLYCCKVMPFGLKNAGATYQQLMNKVFEPLTRKCVEVYVDDMIVKSALDEGYAMNLRERHSSSFASMT